MIVVVIIFEKKMNKDPLLSPKKHQVFDEVYKASPAKEKSVHSEFSNPVLYDLPDMSHITKGVMCKLITVSFVCIIFLAAEVPIFIHLIGRRRPLRWVTGHFE